MFYQILAMMIWSSAFIAAKFAEAMLDPILLVQFRLLIVAIILLPIGIPMFRKLPKSAWKPLIWLSFLNYIAVLILQFKGLQYTSASSALTMLGLEPLLVVFIGHFFFDDKARRYHWICGVLAFIGVFTLILGGQHAGKGGEISLLGCAMVLSGGIVFSAILRPTQKFMRQIPASTYTTLSFIIAAPLCLPYRRAHQKLAHRMELARHFGHGVFEHRMQLAGLLAVEQGHGQGARQFNRAADYAGTRVWHFDGGGAAARAD